MNRGGQRHRALVRGRITVAGTARSVSISTTASRLDPQPAFGQDGGWIVLISGLTARVSVCPKIGTMVDAHGKNFSLLHDPSGSIGLAPLYDLLSTLAYGDDRLAMYVDKVRLTNRVTADRILNEAARWGLSRRRASEIVAETLDRVPDAARAARDETDGVPANVLGVVDSQLVHLRSAFARHGAASRPT